MLTDDHRRRLALFNEKAAKLLRSPLANTESVSIKLTWDRDQPGVVEHEMEGADEAAIDAFVLTARFFFQDRDGISFRRMAEIYDGPSVPASLADRYRLPGETQRLPRPAARHGRQREGVDAGRHSGRAVVRRPRARHGGEARRV